MKNKRGGFTLIELVVVLTIVALLLVVVTPRVTGYVTQARETKAQAGASAVLSAAELYVADCERKGTPVPSSLGKDQLESYLDHAKSTDTYSLTVAYDSATSRYDFTGTYSDGSVTVAIPDMTVSRTSA
jgi:prepilin-type N-terminal cleavage/methylation domain-containing protein